MMIDNWKTYMSYGKIEKIRLKNNTNTLNILRLAFKHNPHEARPILIRINEGDAKIAKLLNEFTLEERRSDHLILKDLEYLRAENNSVWMELYQLAHCSSYDEYIKLKEKAEEYSEQLGTLEGGIWKHLS